MDGRLIDSKYQIGNSPFYLPDAFIKQMKKLLSEKELFSFLSSYNMPAAKGLSINTNKTHSLLQLLSLFNLTQDSLIPWYKHGYFLNATQRTLAGKDILHELGAYYLQEPSAMIPVSVLDPQPGEKILDLCAAPGGKSVQILSLLGGEGILVANDPYEKRAAVLSRNIERIGAANTIVTSESPQNLAPFFQGFFDKILVDAPCSGEGMFRKDPQTVLQWNERSPQLCSDRQKEILLQAYQMLKPGGRLCYSTCTFNEIENEDVVQWFLATFPDCSLLPFSFPIKTIQEEFPGMYRGLPHTINGEGHFVALFQKNNFLENSNISSRKEKQKKTKSIQKNNAIPLKELQLAKEFFNNDDFSTTGPYIFFKNQLCISPFPFQVDLLPIKILRLGLHVGGFSTNRFVPGHSFAISQKVPKYFPRISITKKEVISLLQGGEIENRENAKGWVVFSYHQIDITWGKASGRKIKNHYPKGLRRTEDFFLT
ncbi:MAG: hypothetical protein GX786_07580 [Clostridiales bacterium]|nr:hypothetical protein [Clostridiales bacterium]